MACHIPANAWWAPCVSRHVHDGFGQIAHDQLLVVGVIVTVAFVVALVVVALAYLVNRPLIHARMQPPGGQ
jgi:hypothetical protein